MKYGVATSTRTQRKRNDGTGMRTNEEKTEGATVETVDERRRDGAHRRYPIFERAEDD